MADEVTSETQVVGDTAAQVVASNGTDAPATVDTEREYEKLLRETRAANAEAAKYRVELKALRETLAAKEAAETEARTQAERATLSEVERIKAEKTDVEERSRVKLEEAETKLKARELAIRNAAFKTATKEAKIVDPDAAERLLDWSAVQYDDTGHPTNLEDLLASMTKERPWLIGTPSTVSATNAPSAKGGDRTVFHSSEVTPQMWREMRPTLMQAIADKRWVED